MNSESFGEYIRRIRTQQGLSLRIVGAEINIDQSTLSKIERSEKIAPDYIIKSLSKLYKEEYKGFQLRYLSDKIYRELKELDYPVEALELAKLRLEQEGAGTTVNHKKKALVKKIQSYLKKSPIEKAWLFGSFVREEQKFDSDIDLLVRIDKSSQIDLFDYIEISYELEDLLKRNVDLVQEGNLIPKVNEIVQKEKMLIYERG